MESLWRLGFQFDVVSQPHLYFVDQDTASLHVWCIFTWAPTFFLLFILLNGLWRYFKWFLFIIFHGIVLYCKITMWLWATASSFRNLEWFRLPLFIWAEIAKQNVLASHRCSHLVLLFVPSEFCGCNIFHIIKSVPSILVSNFLLGIFDHCYNFSRGHVLEFPCLVISGTTALCSRWYLSASYIRWWVTVINICELVLSEKQLYGNWK